MTKILAQTKLRAFAHHDQSLIDQKFSIARPLYPQQATRVSAMAFRYNA
jgi:hypothetical protein